MNRDEKPPNLNDILHDDNAHVYVHQIKGTLRRHDFCSRFFCDLHWEESYRIVCNRMQSDEILPN